MVPVHQHTAQSAAIFGNLAPRTTSLPRGTLPLLSVPERPTARLVLQFGPTHFFPSRTAVSIRSFLDQDFLRLYQSTCLPSFKKLALKRYTLSLNHSATLGSPSAILKEHLQSSSSTTTLPPSSIFRSYPPPFYASLAQNGSGYVFRLSILPPLFVLIPWILSTHSQHHSSHQQQKRTKFSLTDQPNIEFKHFPCPSLSLHLVLQPTRHRVNGAFASSASFNYLLLSPSSSS